MILLDTCTFLWLVGNDIKSISGKAQRVLEDAENELYISAISGWEIGLKTQQKLLRLPLRPQQYYKRAIKKYGIIEIPITSAIAFISTELAPIHKDPADRLIVATAKERGLNILTPDKHISQYSEVEVVW